MFEFKINDIVRVNFQILIKMIFKKALNDFDFQGVAISSLYDESFQR